MDGWMDQAAAGGGGADNQKIQAQKGDRPPRRGSA